MLSALIVEIAVYLLPLFFQNMLFQKIVTISYLVIGFILASLFFLVNGASTAIVDGEYEKKYYKSLKEGKAVDEGENFHWNPLKISLSKRIYYSKILLCLLFPIFVVFFMEYIAIIVSNFID
jgi:hypothetical protein